LTDRSVGVWLCSGRLRVSRPLGRLGWMQCPLWNRLQAASSTRPPETAQWRATMPRQHGRESRLWRQQL